MTLRHEKRAVRGETPTRPGARHEPSSLPAHPAFSMAATACPGRYREGRTHLGRPPLRAAAPSHQQKKPTRDPRAPRRRELLRLATRAVNLVDEVQRGFGGRKDVLRQRREVEGSAVALALGDRVVDELFDELALRSVVRHDRVRERRDRVSLGGALGRVHDADARVRLGLLDHRGSFLDVFDVRQLEVAGSVFDRGGTEAGGDQVGRRDVADRARGFADQGGDAGVAFGTGTGFEADRGGDANFSFPGGADPRQVVGERVRVTGAIGTVDRGDGQVRQLRLRVELGDLRVVPVGDRAEVDAGEDLARQVQFLDARNVEADAGGREGPRERRAAAAGAGLFRGHRGIGRADVDGAVRDLFDAFAGADTRVFDRDAFFDFEAVDPVVE